MNQPMSARPATLIVVEDKQPEAKPLGYPIRPKGHPCLKMLLEKVPGV
jgi:hypothetical protein